MQLPASVRVFQISGRCPGLFLWHLAFRGKCYNFLIYSCQVDQIIPVARNIKIISLEFFDLFLGVFFWIWNVMEEMKNYQTCLRDCCPLVVIAECAGFFLAVYFKIKLLDFLDSVCRQHILQSVPLAVQNGFRIKCKLSICMCSYFSV